ncbi:hypothetical protein [Desulforamulus aquiferis]|uniref:Uncharacterized protein n=1 Tax=Desulforamulus aquiferis TaxID=1397668 RepID=A0AAW7Z8Q4_9FIRM|nr:hypothetical protein [Desulforamulus aquiferis]MDO7785787.1 hypothetical protein [Desulforamulus aquiferis]
MYAFTVKCFEARKSITIRAETHKDAARKSGLAAPGVTLTVEGPEEKNVWRRYQVDQAGRLREIASYIA